MKYKVTITVEEKGKGFFYEEIEIPKTRIDSDEPFEVLITKIREKIHEQFTL